METFYCDNCFAVSEKGYWSCRQGGHYLFCYTKDVALAINSVTYEIISATKNS